MKYDTTAADKNLVFLVFILVGKCSRCEHEPALDLTAARRR